MRGTDPIVDARNRPYRWCELNRSLMRVTNQLLMRGTALIVDASNEPAVDARNWTYCWCEESNWSLMRGIAPKFHLSMRGKLEPLYCWCEQLEPVGYCWCEPLSLNSRWIREYVDARLVTSNHIRNWVIPILILAEIAQLISSLSIQPTTVHFVE